MTIVNEGAPFLHRERGALFGYGPRFNLKALQTVSIGSVTRSPLAPRTPRGPAKKAVCVLITGLELTDNIHETAAEGPAKKP
jgi:hypothetical protein